MYPVLILVFCAACTFLATTCPCLLARRPKTAVIHYSTGVDHRVPIVHNAMQSMQNATMTTMMLKLQIHPVSPHHYLMEGVTRTRDDSVAMSLGEKMCNTHSMVCIKASQAMASPCPKPSITKWQMVPHTGTDSPPHMVPMLKYTGCFGNAWEWSVFMG